MAKIVRMIDLEKDISKLYEIANEKQKKDHIDVLNCLKRQLKDELKGKYIKNTKFSIYEKLIILLKDENMYATIKTELDEIIIVDNSKKIFKINNKKILVNIDKI